MDIPPLSNPYANLSEPFKIVVLGDSGVGKTTLLNRLEKNEFVEIIDPTIGAYVNKVVYTHNNKEFNFDFYDTAGQENYKSLAGYYIKNSAACLICFDPSIQEWEISINEWKNIALMNEPKINCIAVATKFDIWKEHITISSVISNVCRKCDLNDAIAVSSLSGENCETLLMVISEKCDQSESIPPQSLDITYNDRHRNCSC